MDRRTMLKRLVQGAGLAAAAIVGVPAFISALSPALRGRRKGAWRRVGTLDEFPVGSVREAIVGPPGEPHGALAWPPAAPRQGVYVWRPSREQVVVFSRACTDLGCPVNYDPGSQCYLCPCHGGIFDRDGSRMAGPADRPLYRFEVRVNDAAAVEIDLSSAPLAV